MVVWLFFVVVVWCVLVLVVECFFWEYWVGWGDVGKYWGCVRRLVLLLEWLELYWLLLVLFRLLVMVILFRLVCLWRCWIYLGYCSYGLMLFMRCCCCYVVVYFSWNCVWIIFWLCCVIVCILLLVLLVWLVWFLLVLIWRYGLDCYNRGGWLGLVVLLGSWVFWVVVVLLWWWWIGVLFVFYFVCVSICWVIGVVGCWN